MPFVDWLEHGASMSHCTGGRRGRHLPRGLAVMDKPWYFLEFSLGHAPDATPDTLGSPQSDPV